MPARERMDAACVIDATRPLDRTLRDRVVGQDQAVGALVCSYSRLLSGLRDPSRPLLTALLLGPTGVGKTETARALAQTVFGSERALTRVNCEEYAHGHELSKLLGSPPGYVGHNIEPLLSQRRIDAPHYQLLADPTRAARDRVRESEKLLAPEDGKLLSIVLFDEIEKAHPILWNALLGILDDATVTLGDNSTTDFTRSIILMTSNVGSREMSEILDRRPVGFRQAEEQHQSQAATVGEAALAAARLVFPFEFLNRFDQILVYSPLEREDLERIFDKFLADIHVRAVHEAKVPLLIRVSPEARARIIDQGTDLRFGARPLRRAMEAELVDPLSRLIASKKLGRGDVVEVEREGDELVFYRNRSSKSLEA